MTQLIINKAMEKTMLKGSTASVRKGAMNWQNIENYNVAYEYPVDWQWWQNIKKVYGKSFDIQSEPETNCQDAKYLTCLPVTKRNTKTGDVLPFLRIKQNVEIDPAKPQKALKYSEKQAAEILSHVKKAIKITAEQKAQKLFKNDCHSLKNMIMGYNDTRAAESKEYKKIEGMLRRAKQKVTQLEQDLERTKAELKMAYSQDVLLVLSKHKYKIPEDLLKELACGYEFDTKVVKHVHSDLVPKIKEICKKIKSGEIEPGSPYSYSFRDSITSILNR